MNGGEIDRLPVSQLSQRYNLARSAVYTRMEALGITTEKVGNKAYINSAQLRLMDDLHRFIQAGGTTPEFLDMRGAQRDVQPGSGQSSGLSLGQPDLLRLITTVAAEVAARFQPAPEPNPLGYYHDLEEAARNGWLLKTSEIAYLLDLSPEEIQRCGDRFQDAGFVFTRVGFRSRGEGAWQVSKRR
ncbi:MAG TPA: hypothetical protein V6D06_18030 [Trichocoleus sp.]